MPLKYVGLGSGLDTFDGEVFELPATNASDEEIKREIPDLFARFAEVMQAYQFDKPWADAVSACRLILKAHKLPSSWGYYMKSEDGQWHRWEHSDVDALSEMQVLAGQPIAFEPKDWGQHEELISLSARLFGYDSEPFMCAQVVFLADRIPLAREAGLNNICEALAFQMGAILMRRRIKANAEETWETGKKVREGGRKGAEARYETRELFLERRNAEIRSSLAAERAAGASLREAVKRVSKRYKVSSSTVRRAHSISASTKDRP